jgi:hypothetical protein
LEWCEENNYLLLTNNRQSMPQHLADHISRGRHIPGVFVVDPSLDVQEIAELLALIAGAGLENEYQDQIRYLPKV